MVGPAHLTNGGKPSYVENAYELLDQPGEWYLDKSDHTVYYIPRKGEDLDRADVEAAAAEKLVTAAALRTPPSTTSPSAASGSATRPG